MALSTTLVYENRGRPHPNPLPPGEGIVLPWAIFMAMTKWAPAHCHTPVRVHPHPNPPPQGEGMELQLRVPWRSLDANFCRTLATLGLMTIWQYIEPGLFR